MLILALRVADPVPAPAHLLLAGMEHQWWRPRGLQPRKALSAVLLVAALLLIWHVALAMKSLVVTANRNSPCCILA